MSDWTFVSFRVSDWWRSCAFRVHRSLRPDGDNQSTARHVCAEAGNRHAVVQNYSSRDCDAGSQVWTIAQDDRGLMYFGVSGGTVLQFDGVTWRRISTPSSVIRSLARDSKGTIWVGADGEIGYLAPDTSGNLRYVSIVDKIPQDQRSFSDMWPTAVDAASGLLPVAGKDLPVGRHAHAGLERATERSFSGTLGGGRQGLYGAGGHRTGRDDGDELRKMPGGEAYSKSVKLFLNRYDANHLIVSARNELLTLYDGEKVSPFPTQADAYLKQHHLYTSTLLNDGSLSATTLDGGAVILSHDGRLLQTLDKASGLIDPGTLTAFEDRDGALWIGMGAGVARVDIDSPVSIYNCDGSIDVQRFRARSMWPAWAGQPRSSG